MSLELRYLKQSPLHSENAGDTGAGVLSVPVEATRGQSRCGPIKDKLTTF